MQVHLTIMRRQKWIFSYLVSCEKERSLDDEEEKEVYRALGVNVNRFGPMRDMGLAKRQCVKAHKS